MFINNSWLNLTVIPSFSCADCTTTLFTLRIFNGLKIMREVRHNVRRSTLCWNVVKFCSFDGFSFHYRGRCHFASLVATWNISEFMTFQPLRIWKLLFISRSNGSKMRSNDRTKYLLRDDYRMKTHDLLRPQRTKQSCKLACQKPSLLAWSVFVTLIIR